MLLPIANQNAGGGEGQLPVALWQLVERDARLMQRGGAVAAAITERIAGRSPGDVVRVRLTTEQLRLVERIIAPLPE